MCFVTNLITVWNVLLIIFFVVAGCFWVDTENWFHPCDNAKQHGWALCKADEKDNMYAAIDEIVEKLDRQLKKQKEKIKNYRRIEE